MVISLILALAEEIQRTVSAGRIALLQQGDEATHPLGWNWG
jgi:hypothetical protein